MNIALVPVKDLSTAKERLAGMLSSYQRTSLAFAMLEDVLEALTRSKGLDRILIVTCDETAMELALKMGVGVIKESEQRGESSSVDSAARICKDMEAESLLVIPLDVPLVTAEDIESILKNGSASPSVILVPSRDRNGTNAILKRPPDVIPSRFGHDSFRLHIKEAMKRGVSYEIQIMPNLSLDIDTPEDLASFMAKESQTKAYKELLKWDLSEGFNLRSTMFK